MRSISVVVPLFNEKPSLAELHGELAALAESREADWEFLYVDDGSRDGSFEELSQLRDRDPRVKVIRFRRNFGKSAALSAGFRFSKGEVVVTMDADLQDKPAEILKLIEVLDQGSDLVSGWKKDRQDPWTKRWPSKVFNWATARLTGVPLHDINCGLKAYRREVIEEIRVYGEMHRYIPVLASYRGFGVSEVAVEHRARLYGKSKYGAARFLGGFFDLLTVIMLNRYSSKPLHVFGIFGGIMFALGLLIELYLSIGWFLGRYIQDRPLFFLGIVLLIVGVQFISFGLLAEMIAYSSRREQDYSIGEILEAEEDRPRTLASSRR